MCIVLLNKYECMNSHNDVKKNHCKKKEKQNFLPVWNCLVAPCRPAMQGRPYSRLTTAPKMFQALVTYYSCLNI